MNTRSLYLALLATSLLASAGAANAAKPMSLADSIRVQMRMASAGIEADLRAAVKQARKLDIEGVEAGPVRLVQRQAESEQERSATRVLIETADAGMDASVGDLLKQDFASKALQVPGLHGVYQYMVLTAINVAITIAE